MKKLSILLVVFMVVIACNNHSKPASEDKKPLSNDSSGTTNPAGTATLYKWTETEKKKFLDECQHEPSDAVKEDKQADLCNCLLNESQKYYPGYKQMNDKSNDDYDEAIYKKCIGAFSENPGE